MAIKCIDYNSTEYQKMVQLREEVLRKPLGLKFSTEDLARDAHDTLIAAFDDDEILGCCILSQQNKQLIKLRQMAVKEGLQGKGIGRSILRFAENVARDNGFKTIAMHARLNAVGFYERLGYAVSSDEFEEVTIPHVEMKKELGFL